MQPSPCRRRTLAIASFVVLALVAVAAPVRAMSLIEQSPMVNQLMSGSGVAFALRFDSPIDHARSTFALATPKGMRTLRVRLNAQPNTLYGSLGELPPGDYTLRWKAQSMSGEMLMGTIPFSVAR